MKEALKIVVLVLGIQLLLCQVYDQSKYSLGNNLVQNYNFELPAVSVFVTFYGSIPSWTCNTKCEVQNTTQMCINKLKQCVFNWSQSLDLNSNNFHDVISQVIEISVAGKYLVQV